MHKTPVKFLVLIESDGTMVAKLYDAKHGHVGDIDATSEEVAVMTKGLSPVPVAADSAWAKVLVGHGKQQQQTAQVFTLDV